MHFSSRRSLGLAALLLGLVTSPGCSKREPAAHDAEVAGRSSGSSGSTGSSESSDMAGRSRADDSSLQEREDRSSGASGTGASSSGTTPAGEAVRSTGMAAADTLLTGKVKAALLADSDLKSTGIAVETNDAEVTLSGALNNQTQIDRAVKLAGGIAGVRSVRNRLTIKR